MRPREKGGSKLYNPAIEERHLISKEMNCNGILRSNEQQAALHNGNDRLGLCIPDVRVYDAACMETLLVFGNDEKPVDGYCEIFHN